MNFKAILSLMGLVCLLLTSCSKEEITPLSSSTTSISTHNIASVAKADPGDDDTVNNPNIIVILSDEEGNGLGDYMIRFTRGNLGNGNGNGNSNGNNVTEEYTSEEGIASFTDLQRGFYQVRIFDTEDELVYDQELKVQKDREIGITLK